MPSTIRYVGQSGLTLRADLYAIGADDQATPVEQANYTEVRPGRYEATTAETVDREIDTVDTVAAQVLEAGVIRPVEGGDAILKGSVNLLDEALAIREIRKIQRAPVDVAAGAAVRKTASNQNGSQLDEAITVPS